MISIGITFLVLLLIIAIYQDLRYRKIKNIFLIIFLIISIEINILTHSSIINLIINLLITFILTFILFYKKILPGGDSKLIIVISSFLNIISKGPYSLLLIGIIFIIFYIYAIIKAIIKSKKKHWKEATNKSIKDIPYYITYSYLISPLHTIVQHQAKLIEITLLSIYILLSTKIKKILNDKSILFIFIIARTVLLPISLDTLITTLIYAIYILTLKIFNTIISLTLKKKVPILKQTSFLRAQETDSKKLILLQNNNPILKHKNISIETESPFSIFIILGTIIYIFLQFKQI